MAGMNNLNISNFVGRKTKNSEGIKERMNGKDIISNAKRSAENSPGKDSKKRSVLGDLTNNFSKDSLKKGTLKGQKAINAVSTSIKQNTECNKKSGTNIKLNIAPSVVPYMPASSYVVDSEPEANVKNETKAVTGNLEIKLIPPGVIDFDEEMMNDPFSEAGYAQEIFEYYKQREYVVIDSAQTRQPRVRTKHRQNTKEEEKLFSQTWQQGRLQSWKAVVKFTIEKYLDRQPDMTRSMRAILVDWMVEVQESFELNHETLYLAVKLIDMFLVKHSVPKTMIQLVGATAALIASKYDERLPPLVDDFLYICDDSYSRSELIAMECKILKTVDFDLGIPVSYRFLRRYARCSKTSMETLTLARFILETSLMEYDLIDERDSKMAAAALLLALKMKCNGEWTPTLQYYCGYQEEELLDLMKHLNKIISPPVNKLMMTIRTKYSHPVFFEVANIEPLTLD